MKISDRYLKLVQWSTEDACYIGTCPGLILGGVHGDNEIEGRCCIKKMKNDRKLAKRR